MTWINKHGVQLSKAERRTLSEFVSQGTPQARVINRARVLLLADEGKADRAIGDG